MTSLRRSPPTQRVVTLLDYFAARPDERVRAVGAGSRSSR